MKIFALNNLISSNKKVNNAKQNYANNYYGLKMSSPLDADTVSFKATNKVADRTWEISSGLAQKINKKMQEPAGKIHEFLLKRFDDLIASDEFPHDPIQIFKLRVKSPFSIKQKTGSRKWRSMDEIIQYMTDLIGAKFVIGEPNKRVIDGVLDRFIPLIKAREIELLEIENKRPGVVQDSATPDMYDYASIDMFEKMVRIQEEVWNGKGKVKNPQRVKINFEDYTKSNYTAVHFLFRLPGEDSQTFELQVIGGNVNIAKEKVDDKIWKILDGKDIENKYKPLVKKLQPIVDEGFFSEETPEYAQELVANARKTFDKYRGEVLLFQRKKPPRPYYKDARPEYFLPLQYRLFPSEIEQKYGINNEDFDFNNLRDLIEDCEEKAKIVEKNLAKGREVQKNKKIQN